MAKEANGNKNNNNKMANNHEQVNIGAGPEFPDVEFGITANGLTVTCPKLLKSTRFLPWDLRGPFSHNEVVECNYVIEVDSLTIFASRFKKAKNIKFDLPLQLRKQGNFRVCGKMLRRLDGDSALNNGNGEIRSPLSDVTNNNKENHQ